MANTILTPTIIAKEALMQLENNMVMGRIVHRDYRNEFKKIGEQLTIRKPVKFRATKSKTRSNSDVVETSTVFTVATQGHVSWNFSSAELTMKIEKYSERYIKPAMIALGNIVDVDLCALYADVHNQAGTPGTTPNAFSALGAVGQRLDEEAAPPDSRHMVFNPAGHWSMADALKGSFSAELERQILRKGYLGQIANFKIWMDQNIQTHTVGAHGGTPLVNGASQTGTSLATDGWSTSTAVLKAGDVITLAGVYAVNPVSGASTGVLRQFVVTADATSDGTGEATLSIYPGITASGAYQTVTASPADNAAITVVGTASTGYPMNLGFHKNAFGLVTVPLEMPAGVWGARESYNQLSLRVVKDYDIDNDIEIIRVDIMYGVKTLYPELACRLVG